ncbi:hypothetical protein PSAB_23500 [Paenibacillus sabinae T27]|uniref:Uncharacterized protein n=1 Tax=Paenibacillus sabinae T27 TaxID=1268072 RepID=X4ZR45_9BACL|nr:hypothetical protein PSAB_23500 [Paenibacillus sabinae T27]
MKTYDGARRNGFAVLWKRKASVSRKNIRLRISAKLTFLIFQKKAGISFRKSWPFLLDSSICNSQVTI